MQLHMLCLCIPLGIVFGAGAPDQGVVELRNHAVVYLPAQML